MICQRGLQSDWKLLARDSTPPCCVLQANPENKIKTKENSNCNIQNKNIFENEKQKEKKKKKKPWISFLQHFLKEKKIIIMQSSKCWLQFVPRRKWRPLMSPRFARVFPLSFSHAVTAAFFVSFFLFVLSFLLTSILLLLYWDC